MPNHRPTSTSIQGRASITPSDEIPATAFDLAAGRLVSALQEPGREAIAPDDYGVVVATLARYAKSKGLRQLDAEEVAAETIEELFVRTKENKPAIYEPSGYLFRVTRNRIIDRHRRAKVRNDTEYAPELPTRYYSDRDDAIAQILERATTAEMLEDALRAARAAQDRVVIAVAIAWLEIAEKRMRSPTSREVATLAGVSHTAVNKALKRFRRYFPAEFPDRAV